MHPKTVILSAAKDLYTWRREGQSGAYPILADSIGHLKTWADVLS
jgi:hypothetical protein